MGRFIPIESRLRKQGYNLIVGIDEVGRGPLAGPVVSAAVILKPNCRLPGLNDSKLLSAAKREALFPKILNAAQDYAIAIVPHQIIDKVNILNATRAAHDLAIRGLENLPDIALIDGRDKQIIDIEFRNIIKGDQKVRCIAAASIIAKVARDHLMKHYASIYPQYGFERNMGYGTREHCQNILKYGQIDIHRNSFLSKLLS
jgi:ribonuclease HII